MRLAGLFLALALPFAAAAQDAPTLDELEGHARPLVIFADTPDDPKFVQQMAMLEALPEELEKRRVVVLTDTDPAANGPAPPAPPAAGLRARPHRPRRQRGPPPAAAHLGPGARELHRPHPLPPPGDRLAAALIASRHEAALPKHGSRPSAGAVMSSFSRLALLLAAPAVAQNLPPQNSLPLSQMIAGVEKTQPVRVFTEVEWDDDGYWDIEFVNTATAAPRSASIRSPASVAGAAAEPRITRTPGSRRRPPGCRPARRGSSPPAPAARP